MESLKKTEILDRIKRGDNLPTLSPLAIQLVELATRDETTAADLAATIEKDPSLATRLLKMVGSVLYTGVVPPKSISQAVVRLGFKRVRIMALSLSLRNAFPVEGREGLDYTHFWKTSLYRALVAHDFAQTLHTVDPDEAFIAGLIAEIGLLLLYNVCRENEKKDFPARALPLDDMLAWEKARFHIDHREVAGRVLQEWHFPEALISVNGCFGKAALAPDAPPLCLAVELAGQATEIAYEQTADLHRLQRLVETHLHLEPETVNTILVSVFSRVEALADQLLIQVDTQADILAVMENANQALARLNTSMEDSLQELLAHMGPVEPPMAEQPPQKNKEVLQNALDAIAHEIRNPLLAIGGFAKRLAEEEKDDFQGKKYANIIVEESSRLEDVLKEIMGYCQDYRPRLSNVELVPLVEGILNRLQKRFSNKNIHIIKDFPHDAVSLRVDKSKISETLTRLLELAFTMAEQGGHQVTISVKLTRETEEVSITIMDNGRPVPQEAREALLDSNLTTKTLGSLFKLSLARKIIEAHKGYISLEVEEGQGNALSVHLPTA